MLNTDRLRKSLLAVLLALFLNSCSDPVQNVEEPTEAPDLLTEAIERFRKAGEMTPEEADPRVEEAAQLIGARRYQEARNILEPLMIARPGLGRATFLLAMTHHKETRYSQARPLLERALRIGPVFDGSQALFYIYGWCLWYLGETDGARRAFEATTEFNPDGYDAWFGLGLVAIEMGQLAQAKRHFEKSIELANAFLERDPRRTRQLSRDIAKASAGLADIALARDDLEAARLHLERCVELCPPAYESWFKLSRVLWRTDQEEAAAEAFRQHLLWKERLGR